MSSNIFNGRRFIMLARQHFIHNRQFLLLSAIAYMGVIFILLSLIQLENQMKPHDLEAFQSMILVFVAIFGVLYVGHAFPAFRSKETTMNYLLVPCSVFEKYLFEFINRLGVMVVILPMIFWITFHLQGYFFGIFSSFPFVPVGLNEAASFDLQSEEHFYWLISMISTGVLLSFVLAFTGAATFIKQPLVKSLFAVAIIMMFYAGFSYLVIEYLGVGRYNLPDRMYLIPDNEEEAFKFFTASFTFGSVVMLFVAYRKLMEKEV